MNNRKTIHASSVFLHFSSALTDLYERKTKFQNQIPLDLKVKKKTFYDLGSNFQRQHGCLLPFNGNVAVHSHLFFIIER